VKARNYDATLGAIREALEGASQRLEAMAAAPAMRFTPDQWTRQVQAAGEAGRREVQSQLEAARREVAEAAGQLRGLVAQATTAEAQFRWQLIWGGAGVLVGVLLFFIVVLAIGATPARWALREKLAATVMREDRWSAAAGIAKSVDPERWAAMMVVDAGKRTVASKSDNAGKAMRYTVHRRAPR
jgi:hypothetical protein